MTKSKAMMLILLAVLIWGLVEVNARFRVVLENPAVERLNSQRVLRAYSAALAAYQQHYDTWPADIRALWTMPDFSPVSGLTIDRFKQVVAGHRVPGVGFYRYRPPTTDNDIVMAAPIPHRAVAAGEPFGQAQAVASSDIPAIHYVLDAQLQIRELSSEEQPLRVPWLSKDHSSTPPPEGGRSD